MYKITVDYLPETVIQILEFKWLSLKNLLSALVWIPDVDRLDTSMATTLAAFAIEKSSV